MTTDIVIYLQNRLIQTSQTGGQRYSDTSPFSIPWINTRIRLLAASATKKKAFDILRHLFVNHFGRHFDEAADKVKFNFVQAVGTVADEVDSSNCGVAHGAAVKLYTKKPEK